MSKNLGPVVRRMRWLGEDAANAIRDLKRIVAVWRLKYTREDNG